MSSESILGAKGVIAQHLSKYEPRAQQLQMAKAVEDAIASEKHLMVEAGTGVGKSFAYLVPAILAAAKGEKDFRIVVSTHTISLQEQLVQKDIPFLQSVMPDQVRPVLVKGRSNYLSLRRLRVAQQKGPALFDSSNLIDELKTIGKWSRNTHEGSRSELALRPAPAVWDQVQSDRGNCLGRACDDYAQCFFFRARKSMFGANLLIVNHALFFSDLALRREGVGMLPKYQVVIFDEAHTLEDVASEKMGLQFGRGSLDYILNKLYSRQRKGLLAARGSADSLYQVEATRQAGDAFFDSVYAWVAGQPRPRGFGGRSSPATPLASETLRVQEKEIVADVLSEELKKLASEVESLSAEFEEETRMEYTSIANRARDLQASIQQWLGQELDAQVYWVETSSSSRGQRVDLASAPIEVGPALKQHLYDQVPSVILASATLSAGGKSGFGHFQDRLGLEGSETLQLGSPFDYREQAELHLFRTGMPDPSARPADYEEAVFRKLPEYIRGTQGGVFVLFTSYAMMRKATERLRPWCEKERLKLLSQSDGTPRSQMVERFRKAGNAVLFGVDSFWQGVDVPGDALSKVIITKLPFAVPDRPVLAARQEAIEASGGNAFFDFQVPLAVIKLKQGFGRLIRTASDTGSVVIFDPRLLTKGYGRIFLAALPECRRWVDGAAESTT